MDISPVKDKGLSQVVKKAIYKYIKSIDIHKCNKLPREEILAEQLGVSRITVRSALNELATEGIIFRRQGKGTFVNKEALQMKVTFNPIGDLRQVIIDSGYEVKVKTVNVTTRTASEEESDKLQIEPEDEIVIIERIFYADKEPAVYCVDRIAKKFFDSSITKEDFVISIFELSREKLGRKITWDKVELSTITNEEGSMLKKYFQSKAVKSFLNCEIVHFDEEDKPIIYGNEYVDTNIIRFNLIRQKSF